MFFLRVFSLDHWRMLMRIGLLQGLLIGLLSGTVVAHDGLAQSILDREVTLRVESQPLRGVIAQLQTKTQVRFVYSSRIRLSERVSLTANHESLASILDRLLKPLKIDYRVINDQVALTRLATPATTPLINAVDSPSPAVQTAAGQPLQDPPITGRVTNQAGDGLPGVSVVIRGSTTGTITDGRGSYQLTASGRDTLVFSFIGYVTQVLLVAARTRLNVTLAEDTRNLSEVVVVGYGTQSRQQLTTSVATVNAKAIERQTVAGFDQALQGQAPGVQVTAPSGQPGSGINIRIRGNNSISLTNSPLYVIDGIPVLPTYDQELGTGNQRPNPLNTLNPNDIESIDVLKDGAAAAIYGLRASNGVVVITTKRGKSGKPQINFSAYYGVQQLRKKIDLLTGPEFARFYNEARTAASLPAVYNPDTVRTATDWQDQIYQQAAIRNYQISARGGNERSRYYLSGAYFNQEGIIRNSGFDRYSFKLNLDQEFSARFRVGTSINLSRTNNNRGVRSELRLENSGSVIGALAQIPTIPVYQPDGRYSLNPFTQSDNPVSGINETRNRTQIYQVLTNVYGEYDVRKDLTFRTSAGIDFRSQIENEYNTRELSGTQNANTTTRGSARTGTNQQLIWLWENTLTYKPQFGAKNDLTLLAGTSTQASNRFTSSAATSGFPSNAVPYLFAGTLFTRPSSFEDEWALQSFFARAIYNYDQRYLLSASVRADGSSRFSRANRFGFFPALSLGWRISKEAFFPQNNVVTDLKVRASVGANGNQEVGPYARFSTYGTGQNYAGTGGLVGGIGPSGIGNNALSWETTTQYNLGLDASLFAGRLTLVADAYLKQTRDLLTSVPLPTSSGFGNITQNIGAVENRGLELAINSTNIRNTTTTGLTWTTQFNVSLNRNRVSDLGQLPNETGQLVNRRIVGDYTITESGQPLGAFYGYQVAGIFQTPEEVRSSPTQPNASAGDLRFVDRDGNGVINASDRTIIGTPNPQFIPSLTNTLTYKGIELSFFFQGSVGNDIYNQNRVTIEGMANAFNQTRAVQNRWRTAGQTTDVPRAVVADPNDNRRFSGRFVESGTYVRLKNLTLAYNLPARLLQRARIGDVRLYATGQNLLTFTNYSGYDPEVSADPFASVGFGRDLGVYPQARTYTFGLNLQF